MYHIVHNINDDLRTLVISSKPIDCTTFHLTACLLSHYSVLRPLQDGDIVNVDVSVYYKVGAAHLLIKLV